MKIRNNPANFSTIKIETENAFTDFLQEQVEANEKERGILLEEQSRIALFTERVKTLKEFLTENKYSIEEITAATK